MDKHCRTVGTLGTLGDTGNDGNNVVGVVVRVGFVSLGNYNIIGCVPIGGIPWCVSFVLFNPLANP
jgi:hypothetical protein